MSAFQPLSEWIGKAMNQSVRDRRTQFFPLAVDFHEPSFNSMLDEFRHESVPELMSCLNLICYDSLDIGGGKRPGPQSDFGAKTSDGESIESIVKFRANLGTRHLMIILWRNLNPW
jgi:hypothetical protein